MEELEYKISKLDLNRERFFNNEENELTMKLYYGMFGVNAPIIGEFFEAELGWRISYETLGF